MIKRVSGKPSQWNIPQGHSRQTPSPSQAANEPRPGRRPLLSPRAAGIFGASLVVALCAAGLAFLMASGDSHIAFASAVFAGVAAFVGAVRFLDWVVES